jgi:hypothetical protein
MQCDRELALLTERVTKLEQDHTRLAIALDAHADLLRAIGRAD